MRYTYILLYLSILITALSFYPSVGMSNRDAKFVVANTSEKEASTPPGKNGNNLNGMLLYSGNAKEGFDVLVLLCKLVVAVGVLLGLLTLSLIPLWTRLKTSLTFLNRQM